MIIKKCPNCGATAYEGENGIVKCEYCGSVVYIDETASTKTESKNYASQNDQYFSSPTYRNENTQPQATGGRGRRKSKIIAILLCLFAGVFGAHRFYEGKFISGVFWLLTSGLGGLGIIIDLLILLKKPNYYY